ncbi:MAG: DUF5362 family protein [Bacteroidota bacterium]
MTKDMNFLGIISIIAGALNCLGIFTAVIGIPIIIAGLRLRDSAEYFGEHARTGDKEFLMNAIEKLSRFFRIWKILTIVYLVLMLLSFAVFIIVIISGGLSMFDMMNGNMNY